MQFAAINHFSNSKRKGSFLSDAMKIRKKEQNKTVEKRKRNENETLANIFCHDVSSLLQTTADYGNHIRIRLRDL